MSRITAGRERRPSGSSGGAVDGSGSDAGDYVLVLKRPPKPRTGRYRGRTEPPDSRPIAFRLTRNRRQVRGFKVRMRLHCTVRGVFVGELRNVSVFRSMRVRSGYRFGKRVSSRFKGGGGATISVSGRFRPPSRAGGKVNAKVRLPGGVRCRYYPPGPLSWSARRR